MSKSKGVPKEAAPVAPVVEEKKAEPVPVIRPLEPPKRLSPEQLAATERAYVSAVGAGGALAVTALRPALASMGVDVRPDLAPIIFRAADEDSGGSLSLVEFQHLYARAKSLADIQLTPQQVRRVVSAVCVSVCLCLVVCVASVWNHRVIGRGLCLVCILLLAVAVLCATLCVLQVVLFVSELCVARVYCWRIYHGIMLLSCARTVGRSSELAVLQV
jgi:hypothetical protein